MLNPNKCIFCGKTPTILDFGDLAYVQCSCGKWNLYEFCGARTDISVKQWNLANGRKPGKRGKGMRVRK